MSGVQKYEQFREGVEDCKTRFKSEIVPPTCACLRVVTVASVAMLTLGAYSLTLLPEGRMPLRRPQIDVRPVSMATGDHKIVVTGLGVISALGSGDEFWNALLAGDSGIDQITMFDASKFPTTIGAEVKDFDPKPYFTR